MPPPGGATTGILSFFYYSFAYTVSSIFWNQFLIRALRSSAFSVRYLFKEPLFSDMFSLFLQVRSYFDSVFRYIDILIYTLG